MPSPVSYTYRKEVKQMRILLVEDEVKISDAVAHILRQNKMEVDVAGDGDEGLIMAQRDIYDVIVLDIMLPGKSGLDILQSIRKDGSITPVLLLTARDTVNDRVTGLNFGADDYLVKPFAMAELQARIKALARRISTVYTTDKISAGNIELDIDKLELIIDDEKMKITFKEAQLLEMLIRKPGMVFSKEQIMDRIWGYDSEVQDNNVEIYIHYLRKKLAGKASVVITTVRGVGYTLEEKKDV